MMSAGSRIPLDVVRAHDGGAVFDDDLIVVEEPSEPSGERLHVGHPAMLADLRAELERLAGLEEDGRAFQLLCRRANHTLNTAVSEADPREHPPYNPVYMNPADMASAGIDAGAQVRVQSAHGAIGARAHPDQNLRPGVVSMAFAYGGAPVSAYDAQAARHPTVNALTSVEEFFDPYTGQPRMTGFGVDVVLDEVG